MNSIAETLVRARILWEIGEMTGLLLVVKILSLLKDLIGELLMMRKSTW